MSASTDLRKRLNNAIPHEYIQVSPGTYEIGWCTIKVPVTLVGIGRVVFKNPVGSKPVRAFRYSGGAQGDEKAYFHCENINFEGYNRAIEIYPGHRTGAGNSEKVSIIGCEFDNCERAIYGAYSADRNVLGIIDFVEFRNLKLRNSGNRAIAFGSPFRYGVVTDTSILGANQIAISMGVPTPRSPDPAAEFQNILVDRCEVENVSDDHKVQAILLMGRSIKVTNSHFGNNRVLPPYGIKVAHTSQHCSIYTKGSQVQVSGCDFHTAAGVMIKGSGYNDRPAQAIITGNFFNSTLGSTTSYTLNEADRWGVQAVSVTSGNILVSNNRIYGMEIAVGSGDGRAIIADNTFRKSIIVRHWDHTAKTVIHYNSIDQNQHDIRGNSFDPESTDNPVYWRPIILPDDD